MTPTKPKTGRPSKLTPRVQKTIFQAVEAGLPYKLAAAGAGVAESTLRAWRAEFPAFSASLKRAEARGALALVQTIRAASSKSWQAAAFLLERRHPEEFARPGVEVRVSPVEPKSRDPAVTAAMINAIFGITRRAGHATNPAPVAPSVAQEPPTVNGEHALPSGDADAPPSTVDRDALAAMGAPEPAPAPAPPPKPTTAEPPREFGSFRPTAKRCW